MALNLHGNLYSLVELRMKAEIHKKSVRSIQSTACLGDDEINTTGLFYSRKMAASSATILKLLGYFGTSRNGHGSIQG